ncbi:hypothetical protein PPL_07804 [Heterostelium album PN500]|uniref:Uncharacterized protein n=1 Tax=Heterostelium pallidum (strain ATCC 26659 / Pp 5 / PN500) TaxID=670386 RepID=D3BH02_HETP5|nr:hypothetical protein PPL_07804 [Heterostelium album PN500]EFA79386.1 hypothetical protein PPL_07804 [Heterostelium album PN500]|eukprot:XP_020431507.1 hypothetical protein PPL_07804 [Heterostelium album PN500]
MKIDDLITLLIFMIVNPISFAISQWSNTTIVSSNVNIYQFYLSSISTFNVTSSHLSMNSLSIIGSSFTLENSTLSVNVEIRVNSDPPNPPNPIPLYYTASNVEYLSSVNLNNVTANISTNSDMTEYFDIYLYNSNVLISNQSGLSRIHSRSNSFLTIENVSQTIPGFDGSSSNLRILNCTNLSFQSWLVDDYAPIDMIDSTISIPVYSYTGLHSLRLLNSNLNVGYWTSSVSVYSHILLSNSSISLNTFNRYVYIPTYLFDADLYNSTLTIEYLMSYTPAMSINLNLYENNNVGIGGVLTTFIESTISLKGYIRTSNNFSFTTSNVYFYGIIDSDGVTQDTCNIIAHNLIFDRSKFTPFCNYIAGFNSIQILNSSVVLNNSLTIDTDFYSDTLTTFTFTLHTNDIFTQVSLNTIPYYQFTSSIFINYNFSSIVDGFEIPLIKFAKLDRTTDNITISNRVTYFSFSNDTSIYEKVPIFNADTYYRDPYIYTRFSLVGYVTLPPTVTPTPTKDSPSSRPSNTTIVFSIVGSVLALIITATIITVIKFVKNKKAKRIDAMKMTPHEENYITEKGKWIGMLSPHTKALVTIQPTEKEFNGEYLPNTSLEIEPKEIE